LIILIANAHHFGVVHADYSRNSRLHSARIAKQSDGLAAYAFPILRRGLVRSLGRLLSGVPFARREVSSVTYSHSRTRCEPRSFEHRKRKGCAILLASCSGALCQSHLEKGLAKDQLLETEPDATRSGMAIETGEPIPTSLPPHPCECAAKPDGVRAIPADHDVYPWGDEPSGAMIQTELSSHPLRNVSKSPSGPVFSSQCQQNRQTLRSRSSTRLQTFSSSLDDCGDRSTVPTT